MTGAGEDQSFLLSGKEPGISIPGGRGNEIPKAVTL